MSRALNGKDDVAPATRQRVVDAAAELGYVPNRLARGLVTGRMRTIGVIVTDNSSPVYARILHGIEEAARSEGFSVVMANSGDSQERALDHLDALISSQVSGVLLVPTQHDRRDLERLRQANMPFVLLLRHFRDDNSDYVVSDNLAGGYLATKHLLDLGHRRIAHIAGPAEVSTAQEREQGYRRALDEAGVAVGRELTASAPFTIEGGYDVAIEFLSRRKRPTAIFAATDRQAVGVLKAAAELKLSVPAEVAIVGGDDIELAEFLAVPLTTFDQRAYEIGIQGVRTLLSRVTKTSSAGDKRGRRRVVLEPELVVRASSGERLALARSSRRPRRPGVASG